MIGFVAVYGRTEEPLALPPDVLRQFLPGGAVADRFCAPLPPAGSAGVLDWQDHRTLDGYKLTPKNVQKVLHRFEHGELELINLACPADPMYSFRLDGDGLMRSEILFGAHDRGTVSGIVSPDLAAWVIDGALTLVRVVPPLFAYIFCSCFESGAPAGWDPLGVGRTLGTPFYNNTTMLDGYSWIVFLSEAFRSRLTDPDRLLPYDSMTVETAAGQYLMVRSAGQPADMSVEELRAWKQALEPLVPGPWTKPPQMNYSDVSWILPEDMGT
jgi:hypothetical protein